MAIYLYQHIREGENIRYERVGEIGLGGKNVIYKQWLKKGEPRNQGWFIDANDINEEIHDKVPPGYGPAIVFDYDPKGKEEIVLLQLLDIRCYTFANEKTDEVWWTPLMFRMEKIFNPEQNGAIDSDERRKRISKFDKRHFNEEVVEFLYLQGQKGRWNWGQVGRVNGALITPDARNYFKQYF